MSLRKYKNPCLSHNKFNLFRIYAQSIENHTKLAINIPGKDTSISIEYQRGSNEKRSIRQQLFHFYGRLPESKQLEHTARMKQIPLLSLIESRLDVLLVRLHWAASIFQARHWIRTKKITLNYKPISHWNTILNEGDIIEFKAPEIYRTMFQSEEKPANIIQLSKQKVLFMNSPKYENVCVPKEWKIDRITG